MTNHRSLESLTRTAFGASITLVIRHALFLASAANVHPSRPPVSRGLERSRAHTESHWAEK